MGILEKIKEIELEMSRTQKNKATEHHLGSLKAKLAKLRTELQAPAKTGGPGEGFDVQKYGDGRVAMIGFPSVGKSTLLTQLTGTSSEAAAYEFTTLTCIPGIIHHNEAKIQLLDLPGIIEGAAQGKGRGRQVIAVAKSADLHNTGHKEILTRELESVGIRLNQRPADVYLKPKKTGGIHLNAVVPLTKIDEKLVLRILQEYKLHNCEILIREDITVDQLIDVIEGNRKYVRCLYVYNKIDVCSIEEVDEIARTENHVPISCYQELNLDGLLREIWDALALCRVYTKKQGHKPDFDGPVVLTADRGGKSMGHFCDQLHKTMQKEYKYGLVWGTSVKHYPQRVGLSHQLHDEDVVQIVKDKKALGEDGRGRFKTKSDEPLRISDRVKKDKLKT